MGLCGRSHARRDTPLYTAARRMPVSIQLLARFSLLGTLSRAELEPLSQAMVLREYQRRAVVIEKGSRFRDLGFLIEGRLQGVDFTVDARSVGLYFVDPGDYFGELALVDGQAPPEHLVALTKSTAAFLDAQSAQRLILRHPELAQAVMVRLAQRVREGLAQRTLLSLPNPVQRLCAMLTHLMQPDGTGQARIEQAPTHQELAIMINSSRETVTRAFQLFFAQQVLERDGTSLRIKEPEWLRDVAENKRPVPKI